MKSTPYRKVFEAFTKGFEMLIGEDGGGHQHGRLFIITTGFKGSPDRDFRFPKAHVSANEPVHREMAFPYPFLHLHLLLPGRVYPR
jgi:hypothetical protein